MHQHENYKTIFQLLSAVSQAVIRFSSFNNISEISLTFHDFIKFSIASLVLISMDFQGRKNFGSFAGQISDHVFISDTKNQSGDDDLEIVTRESRFSRGDIRYTFASDFNDFATDEPTISRSRGHRSGVKIEVGVNPLDLLALKEIQEVAYNDKSIKTLLDDKKYLDYKLPVIQFEEMRLISIKIAPSTKYNSVAPSAMAASNSLILIGNTNSEILVFNQLGQELATLKSKKGLGQVTCIDISEDELFAIAGYHSGHLCLWDLRKGKCKKSSLIHKKPILSVRFWKGLKENVISGDVLGRVVLSEYQKSLVSTSVISYELIKDEIGSVLSIEPLKPEPMWPHPTDTHRIVAIAGVKKIVVYTLDPDVQKIFVIDKPLGVSEAACPCISWKLGMGPEDSTPLHHILAIAWGQRLVLYTFKFAGPEGINITGFLETDTEIKAMFWMSYEIILTLNNAREIRVTSSREFNSMQGDCGKRAILEETNANRDLALQSYLKTEANKEILTYHNTIKSHNRLVFLLGNNLFHKGQLLNWKECLEELTHKTDWLGALAIGLNLYQGRGKKLYGVPRSKDELRVVLYEFLYNFARVVLLPWSLKIAVSIEFCIGIEALDYFFSSLFDFFIDQGSNQENLRLMLNTLEPYILVGQIKSIPTEILGKMIGYYLNAKQHTLIERIIVHLEPTCIDPRHVIPACEEHNLLTAYIFINTNSTMQSFVNPLKKLYKAMTKQKDFQPKLFFCYKILWYFRMCLRGDTFPYGKILPEMFNSVVAGICKWIVKRKHLQNLMMMDSVAVLSVLWIAFEEKEPAKVICAGDAGSPSYLDIVCKLGAVCTHGTFLFHQYNLFVLKTAELEHVVLSKDISIEVSKYFLTSNRPVNTDAVTGKDIDQYITNYTKLADKNRQYVSFSDEEKGILLLKLLKKYEISSKDVVELYGFAENSKLTELQIYLLEKKKDYSKCVRKFVECQVLEIQRKVFGWLSGIFKGLSIPEQEVLKTELMIYLNQLVEIDSDLTAKFVTEWYQNKHLEIVRKLNNAPKLQMKYLGELVKEAIEEDLVFKYVVLLCQNDPKKVKYFLENREDYNFDECLAECMKYQVVEAAAFLNEKLGNVKDALDLLINRAERNKHDFLNNSMLLECIDLIEEDIRQCILLCSRNVSRLDSTEIEEYFFLVLKTILEMYRDMNDYFPYNPNLEGKIHVLIKEVLEHMMALINFNKIITFIIAKFDKIPFKHFKESIFQVLSQSSYQKNIVKRAINLLSNDVKVMTTSLFGYQTRGVTSQDSCMGCGGSMNTDKKEKIIIFMCGHGFHRKCVKHGQCSVCLKQDTKRGKGIIPNSR